MSAAYNLPAPSLLANTQGVSGAGTQLPTAIEELSPKQSTPSEPPSAPAPTNVRATPGSVSSGRDADLLLYFFADQVGDLEQIRIAAENRLRTLTDDTEWGKGLSPDSREAQAIAATVGQLQALEHGAVLQLKRAMRAHYMGPWVKANVGVGEKQAARLLATIGNPYWHSRDDRPRTVSELWAFCGLHVWSNPAHALAGTHAINGGVAPTRTRGVKSNWSADAKMRTYLIAESCIKQRTSPFRPVYDAGREKYAESLHQHECKRCGPKGKPALVGSLLSAGHQHARAMRLVMKELLKDMWRFANPNLPDATRDAHTRVKAASGTTLKDES